MILESITDGFSTERSEIVTSVVSELGAIIRDSNILLEDEKTLIAIAYLKYSLGVDIETIRGFFSGDEKAAMKVGAIYSGWELGNPDYKKFWREISAITEVVDNFCRGILEEATPEDEFLLIQEIGGKMSRKIVENHEKYREIKL
ncbi:hypothetical protein KY308_02575 [Candidatus Woesearchaeota archaeon]|nr:hypothetical protein [Candidatus Woesearchaeota archaeon]